jgi:hypothetical protein
MLFPGAQSRPSGSGDNSRAGERSCNCWSGTTTNFVTRHERHLLIPDGFGAAPGTIGSLSEMQR